MNFPFKWCKNVGRTFVRFATIHAYHGRTDRQTDRRSERMQRGKNYRSHSGNQSHPGLQFSWSQHFNTFSYDNFKHHGAHYNNVTIGCNTGRFTSETLEVGTEFQISRHVFFNSKARRYVKLGSAVGGVVTGSICNSYTPHSAVSNNSGLIVNN